ncbi:MAG: uroporphyrinogen decarboxylase family protein [bacterium]
MMIKQAMTSRQRVLSAFNRTGYDRIPVKHEGTPEVNRMIMDHFGLKNMEQLLRVIGDDFRYVDPVYVGPELRTFPDGSVEGYWGERYTYAEFEGGKYLESSYKPFAGIERLEDLDRSHFPVADWFDYSTVRAQCERLRDQGVAICFGTAGDMDFINSIARARGTEQVLIDLIMDDPVYLEIMEARFRFYYEMHRQALEAAGGLIDFTHIGEDLGTQQAQVISHGIFEKHFAPKFQRYFDMVHAYGARTMMHMCGCVIAFLPRLIELGLDVYDVVQPAVPEMDIAELSRRFGGRLTFCGSVCVQSTLAFGTPAQVADEVKRRLALFPEGGLFLGPTHAIQVGSPLENVLALYRAAGSLAETIDDRLLAGTAAVEEPAGVNMSKLF